MIGRITVLGFLFAAAAVVGAATVPPASATGVVEIEHPESFSRVLVLSDVHGMYNPVRKLLQAAGLLDGKNQWMGGNALLVVIGDSIDKGPASVEVIDLWRALAPQAESAGGRVLVLLGNHEAEFLADPLHDPKADELYRELNDKGITPQEFADPALPRGAFLRGMPVAARIGRWLFAHAGYLPELSWQSFATQAAAVLRDGHYGDKFLVGDKSILEAKGWWGDNSSRRDLEKRLDAAGLTGVIFGHQPKALGVEGASAVSDDGRLIKIDNGMAPEAGSHAGSVLLISEPRRLTDGSPLGAQVILPTGRISALAPENDSLPLGSEGASSILED